MLYLGLFLWLAVRSCRQRHSSREDKDEIKYLWTPFLLAVFSGTICEHFVSIHTVVLCL